MKSAVSELIHRRRSVRTFDGRSVSQADKDALESYISTVANPFFVPVTFRLLSAAEYGLASPVTVGARDFIAAKAPRIPGYEVSVGYHFEKVCVYALSLGLGTVMLAASINRPAFEKAMQVGEDEVMPVASPVGYPADKMSVREALMRKGVRADVRKPFDSLFFIGSFENAADIGAAGRFSDALEAVRLAPSAVNGQPWRAVIDGDSVHFYEARSLKPNALGDVQKVDIGIALAHFDLVAEEGGMRGAFVIDDPGIPAPDNTFYIASYRLDA